MQAFRRAGKDKAIMFKDKDGNKLSTKETIPKIFNRFSNYWLDLKLLLLRIGGYVPSHSFRKIIYGMSGMKMGKGSVIHIGANFFQPKNIEIGEDTIIGDHVFLDGRDKLVIGDHVDVASYVMIYNSEHDLESSTFKAREEPVLIGDYVFIGPRVIILPGVEVGRGAVIAAGAVVVKNVDDLAVVGGVPAKVIGERKGKKLTYKLGRARLFQ